MAKFGMALGKRVCLLRFQLGNSRPSVPRKQMALKPASIPSPCPDAAHHPLDLRRPARGRLPARRALRCLPADGAARGRGAAARSPLYRGAVPVQLRRPLPADCHQAAAVGWEPAHVGIVYSLMPPNAAPNRRKHILQPDQALARCPDCGSDRQPLVAELAGPQRVVTCLGCGREFWVPASLTDSEITDAWNLRARRP